MLGQPDVLVASQHFPSLYFGLHLPEFRKQLSLEPAFLVSNYPWFPANGLNGSGYNIISFSKVSGADDHSYL